MNLIFRDLTREKGNCQSKESVINQIKEKSKL